MYFTLAYDYLTNNTNEKEKARLYIKSCFKGLYWTKPLSRLYVAKCNDERLRKALLKKLIEYTRQHPGHIRFILSPLIDNGMVTGVAAQELWPHLKNITKPDLNDDEFLY
jgi:hypothetical protein